MSKVKPLKTAIIGCGMICDSYFEPIIKNFSVLDIVGCADMIDSKAAECGRLSNQSARTKRWMSWQ